MKYLKENKMLLLCRLKVLGFCSLIILSILAFMFSVLLFVLVSTSVYYSKEKNIVDDYGNLREKERQVIENSLKDAIESKKTNFFFASVYEDINENYASSFPKESVIIYYNNITQKLNTITNFDKLKGKDLSFTLENSEDLSNKFPEYVNSITKNIEAQAKTMSFSDNNIKEVMWILSFMLILILLFLSLFIYSTFDLKIKNELENIAEQKKLIETNNTDAAE